MSDKTELTALEIARDGVSNAAAAWVTAAQEGGEESAISAFDAALAAFEAAVRTDARREGKAPCGCASHATASECVAHCSCACNADFVRVERWECRVACGRLLREDEIEDHECSRGVPHV